MVSTLRVGRVPVTHLDRILYPSQGITKEEVISYYIRVAPRILPFLSGRVVVMQRFPQGIMNQGFFEKDTPHGTPEWVTLFPHFSTIAGREIRYVVCDSLDTLIWMANLAALELHIALASTLDPESPDMLLFDLDPEPPAGFPDAVKTGLALRDLLGDLGLSPFVKTSGKKGLHIVVPLERQYSFDATRSFVHAVGVLMARRMPGVISELAGTHKPGTVFVDYLQNSAWKTMVAPYSLRATAQATVSMPVSWEEIKREILPEDFTIQTAISRERDPWEKFFDQAEPLPVVTNE